MEITKVEGNKYEFELAEYTCTNLFGSASKIENQEKFG